MPDFKGFLDTLVERIGLLAVGNLKDYHGAVTQDGKAFLEKARADLERWSALLELGQLTPDDFAWLVNGKKDLAELAALKQAGIAQARLDTFRNALVGVVIGTAIEKFR